MVFLSRFHKIALAGLGAVGGGLAYYQLNVNEKIKQFSVQASCPLPPPCPCPPCKWINNWDHREPESITKPLKPDYPAEDNKCNEGLEEAVRGPVRHLILIRHGDYNTKGKTDKERKLTELGRKQADLTGQRLASYNIKWDVLISSTMTRAQETAHLIAKHLDKDIKMENCQLIEEGAPIPTEPPSEDWKPKPWEFFQDGARIEAAFRRHFYRPPPEQTKHTYTLLVCHGNVIRYFVCRALQFLPEGWRRISLNHGSITWIVIQPNGHVLLRELNDTGFMEPKLINE